MIYLPQALLIFILPKLAGGDMWSDKKWDRQSGKGLCLGGGAYF
jgi:hypothetical protein